jgi:CheY-like chemotaxis protein
LQKANAERERDTVEKQKVEIERLLDATQQAARLKDEILANMSHEIRTPMNGIIGMTELALDTNLTAEQREHLQTVRNSADSLLGVVNNILDLSKVESGKLDLRAVEFDPHDVVNAAVKSVLFRAREKRLDLLCHVGPSVPHCLLADPLRLRQVLTNLLSNALKFTERGQVTLRLDLEQQADGPVLHFEVADTGIGIPMDKHAVIFEPFTQADGSHTRRYGGNGLGLTICARFVEMMGGRIWVDSEPGKGSHFHFAIRAQEPARREPSSEGQPWQGQSQATAPGELAQRPANLALSAAGPDSAKPATPADFTPLTVLLAEDNPVNQKVAVRLLQKRGHTVVTAANGVEAVEAFRRQPFDAVLMDVQMPEMDGFEATAAIREYERQTGVHTPVIALTAHALTGDRERCLDAGMDEYVTKPIQPALLFAVLERLPNSSKCPSAA